MADFVKLSIFGTVFEVTTYVPSTSPAVSTAPSSRLVVVAPPPGGRRGEGPIEFTRPQGPRGSSSSSGRAVLQPCSLPGRARELARRGMRGRAPPPSLPPSASCLRGDWRSSAATVLTGCPGPCAIPSIPSPAPPIRPCPHSATLARSLPLAFPPSPPQPSLPGSTGGMSTFNPSAWARSASSARPRMK